MTPAEHYAEAERLLAYSEEVDDAFAGFILRQAQIHATLATVDPNSLPVTT